MAEELSECWCPAGATPGGSWYSCKSKADGFQHLVTMVFFQSSKWKQVWRTGL